MGAKVQTELIVPYGAIEDAKTLKQWSDGNVCFGDGHFAMHCKRRWGEEVFAEACRRVKYIPMRIDER